MGKRYIARRLEMWADLKICPNHTVYEAAIPRFYPRGMRCRSKLPSDQSERASIASFSLGESQNNTVNRPTNSPIYFRACFLMRMFISLRFFYVIHTWNIDGLFLCAWSAHGFTCEPNTTGHNFWCELNFCLSVLVIEYSSGRVHLYWWIRPFGRFRPTHAKGLGPGQQSKRRRFHDCWRNLIWLQ